MRNCPEFFSIIQNPVFQIFLSNREETEGSDQQSNGAKTDCTSVWCPVVGKLFGL